MNFNTFVSKAKAAIPDGTVLKNPGGGTSTIKSYSNGKISYERGSSTINVSLQDLFDTFDHFAGQQVSSNDLKLYKPSIYDSKATPAGHDCNCTLLFMILCHLPLVVEIEGQGKKGNPFFVYIPK